MSFHNTKNVSKSFKSPFKNEPKLDTGVEEDLINNYQSLKEKDASLDHEISLLIGPQTDVKNVMNLLHKLNDIKDATQIVLGRLALLEGQTLKQMHERFGLDDKD